MCTRFDSLAVVARHDGGAHAAAIAEALSDDLAAVLGRSSRLRVPRAEFVQPYAASELSAEEIGRALNVRAVALCTIATAGGTVDAAIELIDVLREELVVRESFLVSARELLALQRAMIRAIAPHCDGARAATWHPLTVDESVYARIVQARAARDAEEALAILDGAEDARIEIAAAIVDGRVRARAAEAREALRGIRGSVRALQLQAKLASRFDGDWRGAERALREALEIDPGSPSTHAMLGDVLLATRRREEAAPHHRLVAELMPVDARAQIAACFADYFGPSPLDAAPRLAALPEANDWLVRALVAGGDVLRARQAAATPFGRALVSAFTRDSVYAVPFTAHERALLFSAAGAVDAALDCLESCDDDALIFAAVEPLFTPLAREPRFLALLARLGLSAVGSQLSGAAGPES